MCSATQHIKVGSHVVVAVGVACNVVHLLGDTFLPDTLRGKDSSQGKEEKDISSCIGKIELYRYARLDAKKHFQCGDLEQDTHLEEDELVSLRACGTPESGAALLYAM